MSKLLSFSKNQQSFSNNLLNWKKER